MGWGGGHCLYPDSFFDVKALLTVESPGEVPAALGQDNEKLLLHCSFS